ncbi:MAG: hypothetical protein QOG85_2026 [Gaiellaceae bacterium]|jgi:hypothetical protein|nr:hypothetical protein [Gaiellaceae bacterium]
MQLGLRAILLVVAIILFIIAAISDTDAFNFLVFGLACLAGALLVEELGVGAAGRFSGTRRSDT